MKIHHDADYRHGIIELPNVAFTFSVEASDTLQGMQAAFSGNWEADPYTGGGYRVVPHGPDNNLPALLRDVLDQNNLAEGILARKRGLVWGVGPELYKKEYINGEPTRKWVEDKEINDWLTSWDSKGYLRKCMVDYFHAEVVYSKIFRTRGPRIGRDGRIASLEHITVNDGRIMWPDDGQGIIVADWENGRFDKVQPYPVFNPADPMKYPVSAWYSNLYSFARKFYGTPSYFGAINWIRRSSSVPRVLENLINNSLSIKYHIISPASYWAAKEEMLKQACSEKNVSYNSKMLSDLKDETFKMIGKVLAGEPNVGKYFTSESMPSEFGKDMEKWEILPIDTKIKDYIEAQIKISDKADSATTSGMGLHPSLSNIMVDGKLASGSEQLYALKIFLATETTIPEEIICEALNHALAVNWPDKGLKVGFYHSIVRTEDQVSPQNRTKNVV